MVVSCFLCCRCFGSLLFTTCVLLGSFVIYIYKFAFYRSKKKNNEECFSSLVRDQKYFTG